MPWSTATWVQGIGWTLLYALAVWGISAIQILLEPRLNDWGRHDVASWGRFLIPLVLAFLFGVRVRAWWVFGPPVAIVLLMLTYPLVSFLTSSQPVRQETGTGLILAIFLTAIDAGGTMLGAAAGVLCGKIVID